MTVTRPSEVEDAHKILAKVQGLWVGDVISFEPPIDSATTNALYLLLRDVDKGWQIDPGPDNRTFWKRLFSNDPCDFSGNPIPQTISKITRIR